MTINEIRDEKSAAGPTGNLIFLTGFQTRIFSVKCRSFVPDRTAPGIRLQ